MCIQPTTSVIRTHAQPTLLEAESAGTVLNDDEEEEIMRRVLNKERDHLSRLNAEIQRLESVLAGLYEERKTCVERLAVYSLSLSPQRHLPSELLARIFLEVQGGRPVVLPPDSSRPPWVLQRVCSRWRKVVEEEGRLWSNLEVEDPPYHREEYVGVTWIPQLWSPAQSFPLSLSLGRSSAENGSVISKVLAPYFHRMKSLSLYVPDDSPALVFTHNSCSFDALESLALHICGSYWKQKNLFSMNDPPVTIITTSKKLRTATFIAHPSLSLRDSVRLPPPFYELPWSQLTDLTFRMLHMTSEELESILRQCSALVSLSFTPRYNDGDNRNPNTPEISLPHLESITLVFDKGESCWETFGLLRVPLLKEVTLDNTAHTNFEYDLDYITLIGMIERSGSKLESLSLLGRIQEWEPEDLLKGLPDLMRLVMVRSRHIPEAIFDMMIQGEILQSLEYLECSTYSPLSLLGLLEHLCTFPASGERHGITTAKVLYGTYTTERELETINELYERLKPKLESCGKDIALKRISPDSPTYWR